MIPALAMNQATFRKRWSQAAFLEGCARHGIEWVSLWLDPDALAHVSELGRDLARLGLKVSGVHRLGPIDFSGAPDREADLRTAAEVIGAAAELGADHVFLFTGGLPVGATDLEGAGREVEAFAAQAGALCGAGGVRLAIEPLHPMLLGDRTLIASLKQAFALCRRLGAAAGVVVDVHHVWWDPDLDPVIAEAGAEDRLLGFHVNDWRNPTEHRLTDRGMVGDGIIPLRRIWQQMLGAGFSGPIEVEIFSEYWWDQDPDDTMALAINRCREIFV